MKVTYYFDPLCPFTWRTSRWLGTVAAERGIDVSWRPFSLFILNDEQIPDEWKAASDASWSALRLVAALDGNDQAGAFYTEIGNRTHEAGVPISDEIVRAAAEAAGVTDLTPLDSSSWDAVIRSSHEEAFASAGPDIGSPVLAVEGAPRAVHGPIIDNVPAREEALAIWDAVLPLTRSATFFELKRGRQ